MLSKGTMLCKKACFFKPPTTAITASFASLSSQEAFARSQGSFSLKKWKQHVACWVHPSWQLPGEEAVVVGIGVSGMGGVEVPSIPLTVSPSSPCPLTLARRPPSAANQNIEIERR